MGAWGHDIFENDTAVDWVYELEEEGLPHLEKTLENLLAVGEEYLGADLACEGLAAAETLARGLDRPGQKDSYTEDLDNWLAANRTRPSQELLDTSLAAIDRILGPDSELRELWEESDEASDWKAKVEDLRQRLRS